MVTANARAAESHNASLKMGASPATGGSHAKDEPKKRGRPKDAAKPRDDTKRRKTKGDPKPRGPVKVDVDKQCGVPLVNQNGDPTGALCARSLTCKTHSMGAKRAVVGRSQPYDVLLAAYHQRNLLANNAAGGKRRGTNSAGAGDAANSQLDEPDEDAGPPLSGAEEIAAVLQGTVYSAPIPLHRAEVSSTRLRSSRIDLRELLYKATSIPPPLPPVTASSPPLASVMSATDAILGRCVVFNPISHVQNVRPSQIYANTRLQQVMQEQANRAAK